MLMCTWLLMSDMLLMLAFDVKSLNASGFLTKTLLLGADMLDSRNLGTILVSDASKVSLS